MTPLLQDLATRQAERRPDATAVVMNGDRLTYGMLETLSNQVAHVLRAAGCERGDRVAFLIPKSPTAIAAMLGILKADCCYVPLDVASPAPRLAKMVESAEPRVILAAGRGALPLRTLLQDERLRRSVRVGWLDPVLSDGDALRPAFTLEDVLAARTDRPDCRNSPSDLAHILFTSGSTGTPKGVMITHENVLRFLQWAVPYFRIRAEDRQSGHSPLHFDLSTFDVYGTFAAGAQLHLVPPELNVLPHKLAEFIRQAELTQWFSVPSALSQMAQFDVVRAGDFPHLRRLLWCGEVFPTPVLRYWMARLPHVTFTNLYGPTEATIASSYYTLERCPDDDRTPIPIGSPCAGEELLVLDQELRPVPPGVAADLYIRGVGLSPGYWRDPEKTAGAFVPNPLAGGSDRLYRTGDLAKVGPDGLVYFLGRADSQIKSRGYRIELGEIEAALQTLKTLEQAVVVALPGPGFEGAVIGCAYVPRLTSPVTPLELRRDLGRLLPSYMLPSRWRAYDRLPRNANGKIDRRRIKEEWIADEIAAARPS
ncbi:MAG TPA: amino acid adenylation domain-containing protein [Gemmatimonadales bacterium]|nr:amino acid adenylation domain-containing protein [Gemmatimonadales bacterium]